MVGCVLWSNENKKDSTAQVGAKKEYSTAQVGAKKELSNGMGAVEYPNPIGKGRLDRTTA